MMNMSIRIANANIVTAFDKHTIGTKVTDTAAFTEVAKRAIASFDFAGQRVPGQGFIMCPEAIPFVSAGVGRKLSNPDCYVCHEHRGVVSAFLKREYAVPVEGCALVVYTTEAYLADPDVQADFVETSRIKRLQAAFLRELTSPTHVLVAVLAFAGPKAPLTPERFVHNLAGGNKEALTWNADEIRTMARDIVAYDQEWSVVAD